MIRDHFRILTVDITSGKGKVVTLDGRDTEAGGSGLAALLFNQYGHPDRPWDDPEQPLIFAIGPLTGYFPLMSKTVCGFKSPYHDQYGESHAGGRSAFRDRSDRTPARSRRGARAVFASSHSVPPRPCPPASQPPRRKPSIFSRI